MELTVKRVMGRTEDSDKVVQFTTWLVENMERLEESNGDLIEETGVYEIGYQDEIGRFVVEVKTMQDELAEEIEKKYQELKFEENKTFRVGL